MAQRLRVVFGLRVFAIACSPFYSRLSLCPQGDLWFEVDDECAVDCLHVIDQKLRMEPYRAEASWSSREGRSILIEQDSRGGRTRRRRGSTETAGRTQRPD